MTNEPTPAPDQEELESHYLTSMRRRFKAEVNRMIHGGMARHLNTQPDRDSLIYLLSYLYAFHWLRHCVHPRYRRAALASFRGPSQAYLTDLLDQANNGTGFVHGYIHHWETVPASSSTQQRQLLQLLGDAGNDASRLAIRVLGIWDGLELFSKPDVEAYRIMGRQERERYGQLLGTDDRSRLALVDTLPPPGGTPQPFAKLGLIPAMGCPQTCRHCMFIWRPPMGNTPDPEPLFRLVDNHTENLLFTGGDLTGHLSIFTRAIRSMEHIRTFAILLNGDFAHTPRVTNTILNEMAAAIKNRPNSWPAARVLLQISFDEFHQEILTDSEGRLRERIPVAKIANIIECVPRYGEIQLCLLHKQNALNFSMDLFRQGVFSRLLQELGRRNHQVQILATTPSPRHKRHPLKPEQTGQVLKDASFILTRHPNRPILFMSSTVDAYGRATLLDECETVREQDLLHQVLQTGPPGGETFDTDLMFWFNGWVTLFSAAHICLGDVYQDGMEIILARYSKDPLLTALRKFDRRLLAFYSEIRMDLEEL
ncbi:MAG: hypothetical protein GY731_02965, partial [Gammaproteobacteria bacterium]|nr:hypothetical protein [Gammaproteobacteria bacterium]